MEIKRLGIGGRLPMLSTVGMVRWRGPVRDFVTMLVAAIGTGLLVSLAVAAIALALAGTAQAAASTPTLRDPHFKPATAAKVWIGEGCESLELAPLERDWHVSVSARGVTIRAMTTYRLPAEYDGAVFLSGILPRGARMMSLLLQGERREVAARLLKAGFVGAPDPQGNPADPGAYASEPIAGLQADESFVVTLKFEIRLRAVERLAGLAFSGESPQDGLVPAGLLDDAPSPLRDQVWIEWSANRPARIAGAPATADVEWTKGRVEGVSWSVAHAPADAIRLGLAY